MNSVSALFLAAVIASTVHGEDIENPFKNAKVGDWAAYKTTKKGGVGADLNVTTKKTVVAVSGTEVILKVLETLGDKGKDLSYRTRIKLKEPLPEFQIGVEGKESKETIKVGGKEYDCKRIRTIVKTQINGKDIETEINLWTCKDVPLSGLVKMTTILKSAILTSESTTELTGFGRE